jgi:hypothetical protein
VSGPKVTYLDFGTKQLHLGQSPHADIALCGFGAGFRTASFKDRPGLFESEMCSRCLRLSTSPAAFSNPASREGKK